MKLQVLWFLSLLCRSFKRWCHFKNPFSIKWCQETAHSDSWIHQCVCGTDENMMIYYLAARQIIWCPVSSKKQLIQQLLDFFNQVFFSYLRLSHVECFQIMGIVKNKQNVTLKIISTNMQNFHSWLKKKKKEKSFYIDPMAKTDHWFLLVLTNGSAPDTCP